MQYSNIIGGRNMDEQFIRDRITQLRIAAGKSEREMSLDLGHSGSYINSITSGRIAPSMKEFLYICEYLQVTPEQFFQTVNDNYTALSPIKQKAISELTALQESDVILLLELMKRFQNDMPKA